MENNNNKITIDELARMIQGGFNELREEMNGRFNKVEGDISELKEGQKNLEQGHEKIMLRLDNVAHRFELKELEERVVVLEQKVEAR